MTANSQAEHRQREQLAQTQRRMWAQQTQEARRARAAARLPVDVGVFVVALILCATVLVPWLIGRFLLRDQLVHARASEVFDPRAREDGAYFLADWTIGCAVVLALAATIILIGRWQGRIFRVVLAGAIALSVVFVLLPFSANAWQRAEQTTASTLQMTVPPLENYCGGEESIALVDENGESALWTMIASQATLLSSDWLSSEYECRGYDVYKGWAYVGTATLGGDRKTAQSPGMISRSNDYFFSGDGTVAGSSISGLASDGSLVGFRLADLSTAWNVAGAWVPDTSTSHITLADSVAYIGAAVEDGGSDVFTAFDRVAGTPVGTLDPCPGNEWVGNVASIPEGFGMTELAATTLAGNPSAATAISAMCVFEKANGGNDTAWWFAMLSGERVPVPEQ